MCLFQPLRPLLLSPSSPLSCPCTTPFRPLDPLPSDATRSSRLFLSLSLFFSPSPRSRPPLSPTGCTTAYLLLASPLNGISVLSDGPRAELRSCTSLARFFSPWPPLPRLFSYSGSLRNISLERRCFSRLHDSAIIMRYEIDIVTDVMEPSTIFRD